MIRGEYAPSITAEVWAQSPPPRPPPRPGCAAPMQLAALGPVCVPLRPATSHVLHT